MEELISAKKTIEFLSKDLIFFSNFSTSWRAAERMHVHVGAAWGIVSGDTDLDAGASLMERLLHQRLEDDQKLLERKLQHDQTLLDQVLLDQRLPRPDVMQLLPVASCMVSLRF